MQHNCMPVWVKHMFHMFKVWVTSLSDQPTDRHWHDLNDKVSRPSNKKTKLDSVKPGSKATSNAGLWPLTSVVYTFLLAVYTNSAILFL